MTMANPKIIYDPGAGPATLSFMRPPRRVPGYAYEATRHDNVARLAPRAQEPLDDRVHHLAPIEVHHAHVMHQTARQLPARRVQDGGHRPERAHLQVA